MAQDSQPDNVIRPSSFTGGPSDPSVEARLGRLESMVDQIRMDVSEIKGRLANMPTTVTLLGLVVTILAAGFGMALAVVKLASGH